MSIDSFPSRDQIDALEEKAIFRIFNKKTKKYISIGSKSKTTWRKLPWVENAIHQELNRRYATSLNIDDLEIHIFPISEHIAVDGLAFQNYMKDREAEKKKKKEEKEKAYQKKLAHQRVLRAKKELEIAMNELKDLK